MIHVVGNAAVDLVLRLDRLPRAGETLVARAFNEDLGGKGANQAIVIARCGEPVRLVAGIGADAHGERIRRSLETEGVETDGLRVGLHPTDRCLVYVDDAGENIIVSLIESALGFDPLAETAPLSEFALGDWLAMQGNLAPGITRDCLARAKRSGATTVLNPSPTWPVAEYDWSRVDLAIVNRGEAAELGGVDDPLEAARALLGAGAGLVALTLGDEGAAMLGPQGLLRAVAPRVAALDTVGAGDVFAGVLIAARASGHEWGEALHAATQAASLSVQRRGVLASFPSAREIADILPRRTAKEL